MPKFSYFWALCKWPKNLGDVLARGLSYDQYISKLLNFIWKNILLLRATKYADRMLRVGKEINESWSTCCCTTCKLCYFEANDKTILLFSFIHFKPQLKHDAHGKRLLKNVAVILKLISPTVLDLTSSRMKYFHFFLLKAWWSWITSLYDVMQTWNAFGFVQPCKQSIVSYE